MKKTLLVWALAAMTVPASAQLKLTTQNVDEIIAAMTVEEKVDILIGCGQSFGVAKFPELQVAHATSLVWESLRLTWPMVLTDWL